MQEGNISCEPRIEPRYSASNLGKKARQMKMRNETLGVPMKCVLLTSLAVLGTAFGAHAADLLVQNEAASAPRLSFHGYVQVMGGISKRMKTVLIGLSYPTLRWIKAPHLVSLWVWKRP